MKATLGNIIWTVFVAALFAIATGCKHTAHGAGEDIERMGEKIQEKTR